jgi:hypothetical protein
MTDWDILVVVASPQTRDSVSQPPSIDRIVVPVESDVFVGHEDASMFVGITADRGHILRPAEYRAENVLRANVYIDEHPYVAEEAKNYYGGETDQDDIRSVSFAVLQNRGENSAPIVIGAIRLIVKRDVDDLLPVERQYPEAFASGPAPVRSAEGSRYIARHWSKRVQHATASALVRVMSSYMIENLDGPVFAQVELSVARLFRRMRMPYEQLCEGKTVNEYGTYFGTAIRMEPERLLESSRPDHRLTLVNDEARRRFFRDARMHNGLGYFDMTLTNPMN